MLLFMTVAALVSAAAAVALTLLGFTRWFVIGLAALLITFGVTPATISIAENVARADASTYNEYWNGYELAATSQAVTCERDGSCANDYSCDPYPVTETYTETDSKGNVSVKTRVVIHYHQCPYSTQETSYYVNTTLGQVTIAANLMTGGQWRSDEGIPGGRQSAPKFWLAAKARVEANKPGPVTQVHSYENFILASQTNLFKKYSGTIKTLTKQNLLPSPTSGIFDYYSATKAYFAGTMPKGLNRAELVKDVAYLNGAVGAKLHGDVHVVFVNAAQAPEPTDYLNALMAYWQSPAFGRNAISKNSIVIAVGVGTASQMSVPAATPTPAPSATTGGATQPTALAPNTPIALWARAATGMPIGNEAMLIDVRNNLRDQPINSLFIGRPTMNVRTQALTNTDGLIENTLFGVHRFERVSMNSDGKTSKQGLGYKYLEGSIPVAPAAYIVSAVIITLLGAGLVALAIYLSALMSASTSSNYTSTRFTGSRNNTRRYRSRY